MALALAALHIALMFNAASVFVAAAVNDACSYRIPNYMSALLLLLFPFFVVTAPFAIDWHQHLGVFALVALSGFGMFMGHLIGAGDIKLLASASLWAGPHFIAVLLVVTAIAGGILSIVMAIMTHYRHRGAENAPPLDKIAIPYGIAIAAGGLSVLGLLAKPILLPG